MRKLIYVAFSVLLLTLLIGSCKHYPPVDLTPDPVDPIDTTNWGTVGIPCDPDTVYFANDILPLITSNCAMSGCHDAASHEEGIVLDNYNNIMNHGDINPFHASSSDLYQVITENNPSDIMPPPPHSPLTQAQINMIATWINQGALNNECQESQANCNTANMSYANDIRPTIQSKCLGCHSGSNPGGGRNFSTWAGVFEAAVTDNRMMGSIMHQSGFSPMPPSGLSLTNCEIVQMQAWIDQGGLNN